MISSSQFFPPPFAHDSLRETEIDEAKLAAVEGVLGDYEIEQADPLLKDVIPSTKGVAHPLRFMTTQEAASMVDSVTDRFLPEYTGCMSVEMWRRPLPQLGDPSKFARMLEIYEEWAPACYEFLRASFAPFAQVYDRRSRLGFPSFAVAENKVDVLLPFFERFSKGDITGFEEAFVTSNVRLQAEPRAKVRYFTFLTDEGTPYAAAVGARERVPRKSSEAYGRITSRTRNVYNYPLMNLYCQIADNAFNRSLLRYPAFHHDMTKRVGRPLPFRKSIFLDVSHMERITGFFVSKRAPFVGPLYHELNSFMLELPFLCPSQTKRVPYFIRKRKHSSTIVQLASGISSVSPIQKELMLCLYAAFAAKRFGYDQREALRRVAEQTCPLVVLNQGDDNVICSDDPKVADDCFSFLKEIGLPVAEEDPPKFLGYQYSQERGFFLGLSSAVLNFFLPERQPGSRFRPFPWEGMFLARQVYRREGDPIIARELYPFVDELLDTYGYTSRYLEEMRKRDRRKMEADQENELVLLEKEYRLTDEEKMALPSLFNVLPIDLTTTYLNRLVQRA